MTNDKQDPTPGTLLLTMAWVLTGFTPAYLKMFKDEPVRFFQGGEMFVVLMLCGVLVGIISLSQSMIARPASVAFAISGLVAYNEMRSMIFIKSMWGWIPVVGLGIMLVYNAWSVTKKCAT
jgi:hypothetical protein